jgi:hypothetical protein
MASSSEAMIGSVNLADLTSVNRLSINQAGARYTPGVEAGAPNIHIGYLLDLIDSIALRDGFREMAREHAGALTKAVRDSKATTEHLFRHRQVKPVVLASTTRDLAELDDIRNIRQQVLAIRRHCSLVTEVLEREESRLQEKLHHLTVDERSSSDGRELDRNWRAVVTLSNVVDSIHTFYEGPNGEALAGNSCLMILGNGGTGKTHLLCDIAAEQSAAGKPALLVLSSSLPKADQPLEAIASATGLTRSGKALLEELDHLGRRSKCRSLLLVDAINEGDRAVWRSSIARLAREVGRYRKCCGRAHMPATIQRNHRP